ncbi:MAG: ComEA family DNA-binding protein [Sandaracinaceae bacterium]|nr:ComEA family DNA-binding protein [Sandaracinaceae bacterium]
MTKQKIRCVRSLVLASLAFALAALPAVGSAQPRARQQPAASAETAPVPGVVNIQTASQAQLELLPGIGPSKAAAIVAHRERQAFRRVEDIMRVRGIGRATFRRLRPMLTVDGPTTLTEQARAPRAVEPSGDEEAAD